MGRSKDTLVVSAFNKTRFKLIGHPRIFEVSAKITVYKTHPGEILNARKTHSLSLVKKLIYHVKRVRR